MSPLPEHEADLARALRRLEPKTAYAEVMAEVRGGFGYRHDRQSTTPSTSAHLAGAVFRAWDGTRWAEVVVTGFAPKNLDRAATELGDSLSSDALARTPPGPSASTKIDARTHEKKPAREFTLEEQGRRAKELFNWATSMKGIENAIVSFEVYTDERLFLNFTGARCYGDTVRTRGTIVPLAIENGRVEYDFAGEGMTGGVEVLDSLTEERVRETAGNSIALLHAKSAPTGRMNVLLDPGTAGTFAHESFGHGTEADQLLRDRSYLKPLLGQKVGPEILTLVDDGSYPEGWGSIFFDDEGHPSQRTVLVDHGRFVEVLHDRDSAAAMGLAPTGNTRRADYLSRPFVRMTNTFVEPGEQKFDELVRETKDGVLLEKCTSGIEDPLGGNMQIKVKMGHRIEHGEVTDILPSMALSGKVLEFLREIRAVGQRTKFEMSPGFCGKGHTDLLPAGTGGSYLLSRAVVGPA